MEEWWNVALLVAARHIGNLGYHEEACGPFTKQELLPTNSTHAPSVQESMTRLVKERLINAFG